jgi:CTP:molybdopterin cytidylyltransferase MocA
VRVAAILLAAGEGRRIGGPKALLRIDGETFLTRCSRLLLRPDVERLVVVLGHEAERVCAFGGLPKDALRVVNAGYREGGMLSSILRGLDAAEAIGVEAVLIHPVDHPLVAEATVERVVAALDGGGAIVAPSCAGRRGHPGGFARAVWPLLRDAPAEGGARAVLQSHPEQVVHVAGDPGSTSGIDTPEDYERLVGERRAF